MNIRSRVQLSTEAIAPQSNPILFKSLVGHLTNMRNTTTGTQVDVFKSQTQKELVDVIAYYTNLPVVFEIVKDGPSDFTFAVSIPVFTDKHPIGLEGQKGAYSPEAFKAAVTAIQGSPDKVMTGWVDRKTGKVHGLFSKLEVKIYVGTSGLLDTEFTPEYIAGILIHELGHVVSYYEMLSYNTSTSWAIRYAIEAIHGTEGDSKEAVVTMSKLADILSVDDVKRKELLEARNKKEAITLVILDEATRAIKSDLGTTLADLTGFEFVADQFAVRHGAAAALANALNLLYRKANDPSAYSRSRFLVVQAAKVTYVILSTAITLGTVLPVAFILARNLASSETYGNTYDNPIERLKRIRNDLVQGLKQSPDRELSQRMLADIQSVDAVIAQTKQFTSVFEVVSKLLFTPLRLKRKQQSRIQELESLFNNPLFIRQAQLSQLTDTDV